jgi:hypothetical protein
MKLATIRGQDGKRIVIGTALDGEGKRRLVASNGDDVHPSPRPYKRGALGTAQAVQDIWAMWGCGGGWNLEFAAAAESIPEIEENSGEGYEVEL